MTTATANSARGLRDGRYWMPVVLLAAGVSVYYNSFSGAFVFDDLPRIVNRPEIRHLWPAGQYLADSRPMVGLSLAVNYALGGLNVWGYHAFNLGVHLLATLALFGIVRRSLSRDPFRRSYDRGASWLPLAVALLWMVHPLQTQSVTYLIQRGESMMGLFYLLTLYCVIRGADSPRAWGWYTTAVVFCALGMDSKPVMVTAPVVVLLYDRAFLSKSFVESFRQRRVLYAGLAATWSILVASGVVGAVLFPTPEVETTVGLGVAVVTPLEYAFTQPGVILHYLKLSFWPASLCLDYVWPVARTPGEIVPPAIIVGLLLLGSIWAYWKKPWLGFVGAWFFLILAPTSSCIPIQDLALEHRVYLSLAAVMVLVVITGYAAMAWLLQGLRLRGRRVPWIATGLVITFAALLGSRTVERNRDYRSRVAIWRDVVDKRPNNARAHDNLGEALASGGELDEAISHFQAALRIDPNQAGAHSNLGGALTVKGRPDDAIEHCRAALRINPDFAEAYCNLGNALADMGRVAEALGPYRRALEINPGSAKAHAGLAKALAQRGASKEAIKHYRWALRVDPDFANVHVDLGVELFEQGRHDEAIEEYRAALRIDPHHPIAHCNLGNSLSARGEIDEALAEYRLALHSNPRHVNARIGLGNMLQHKGQPEAAIEQFREGIRLSPRNVIARCNLAAVLASQGRRREALELVREASEIDPNHAAVRRIRAALRE